MSININIPLAGLRSNNFLVKTVYFLMSAITILYVTQAYRIFLSSSDFLLLIRFTEDYVLLSLLFITLILKGNIQINNIIPFCLLFLYLGFNYLYVVSDFGLVRRFLIIMLWYTIAINIIAFIRINHFFYLISFVSIICAGSLLFNIEATIATYVIENQRLHTEGEGLDLNINNINLILVSMCAIATILNKNAQYIKYGNYLLFTLYILTGSILLIGATRSASLFYILIVAYYLFTTYAKLIIVPTFLILFFSFGSLLFFQELVLIQRFVEFDAQTSGRYLAMINSLTNFSNAPFFGVGEFYQETIQMRTIGDPDHNFFTRLLGSNGLVGFTFIVLFLWGLVNMSATHLKGLVVLKGFFFFSYLFAPAGPGALMSAITIYYLVNLDHNEIRN